MRGINKVILLGTLGKDPESKSFANGGTVCNFSIATSEQWQDKNSGDRKEATEWHRIVADGRLAEICQQYLKKGSKIYIEGRIRTRKWQNQQGQDQYTTEVRADQMQMLSRTEVITSPPVNPPEPPQPPKHKPEDHWEDDWPF